MRLIACMLVMMGLGLPCIGCGESKPDPREREDFVDTTDPSAVMQTMDKPAEDTPKPKQ